MISTVQKPQKLDVDLNNDQVFPNFNCPKTKSDYMACNGVLTPQQKHPPSPKIFQPLPPFFKIFSTPLPREMAASAIFTHGYFQQAHVHISEAIITD